MHSRFDENHEAINESILHVEWHESVSAQNGGPFSVELQAPIVMAAAHQSECPFFPARSVLPIKCCAMQAFLPRQGRGGPAGPRCYVLIRRQWHSLGAVEMHMPWHGMS